MLKVSRAEGEGWSCRDAAALLKLSPPVQRVQSRPVRLPPPEARLSADGDRAIGAKVLALAALRPSSVTATWERAVRWEVCNQRGIGTTGDRIVGVRIKSDVRQILRGQESNRRKARGMKR